MHSVILQIYLFTHKVLYKLCPRKTIYIMLSSYSELFSGTFVLLSVHSEFAYILENSHRGISYRGETAYHSPLKEIFSIQKYQITSIYLTTF